MKRVQIIAGRAASSLSSAEWRRGAGRGGAFFKNTRFQLACLLLALVAACVSGNTASAAPAASLQPRLVWPSPPDDPRIEYLKSISGPSDIGSHPSRWQRLTGFLTGESVPRDGLVKPFGVAVDDAGNLCVTDTANRAVYCCDFAHKQWRRWDAVGKTPFASPVSVAHRHGTFYVADSEAAKVFAFDEKGRAMFTLGAPLQRPVSVALSVNSLMVVDVLSHAVFVYELNGRFKLKVGTRGTGPGEFNFPTHISIDNTGHWFVTDSLNSRIQVFDANGKFQTQIGSAGDAPGHFGRPKGVAADNFGHIYVADAVFDNIQVFDLSGRLLLNLGQNGSKPGEFGVPAGIAIGANNQIYVADSYNHRVQIFQYIGAP